MNAQNQFLAAVALRRPYAFADTGDVSTDLVATAPGAYPAAPVFSVNELLPALRSERAKVGWVGFGAGVVVAAGGLMIYRKLGKGRK